MKQVLLVLLLTASTFILKAQTHTNFGVKGGLNIANFKFQNSSTPNSRLAFHLGALAHVHVATHWAVQPELLYSGQGAKSTSGNVEYKYKLNYVNVPVILQYMTGSGLRLEAGPQLGIMVSAKQKAGSVESDIKNNFKTFELAWALGLGYISNSGFGVDGRYNIGLTDINNQGGGYVKNRVWELGIFYQLKGSTSTYRHVK